MPGHVEQLDTEGVTLRFSIHVDAGYLYAALATRLTGSANRAAVAVDVEALIKGLIEMATVDARLRLLRVLWYDAAKNGIPDTAQRRIGVIDSVKLRMGRINPYGDQKGVDLRLGLDLVSLGVNRAAEVAYLVSGDDDLTEAVTDAQDLGLQVKLIVVPGLDGRPHAVAENLTLAADGVLAIPADIIDSTVQRATRAEPVKAAETAAAISVVPSTSARTGAVIPVVPPTKFKVPAAPPVDPYPPGPIHPGAFGASVPVYVTRTGHSDLLPGGAVGLDREMLEEVAKSVVTVWATTATPDEVAALLAGRPNVPSQIDRILLTDLVTRSGVYDIPTWARFDLRDFFWNAAEKALKP